MSDISELIIRNTFAYHLIDNHSIYIVYPREAGMTNEEFVKENWYRLRDLTHKINKMYGWNLVAAHKGPIQAAIRFVLTNLGIPNYARATGRSEEERARIIEAYKGRYEYTSRAQG